ncbi:MAG: hypothetical protein WDO73_31600 [Ignavibacteriota bacterium]
MPHGSQLAKDRAAEALTKVMIPEAASYPRMSAPIERQAMDVDIACVGFGPATAGFLAELSKNLVNPDGSPAIESRAMPGLPLQVVCYERADDVGFGVSGVVTRARGIRATLPELNFSQIPMAARVVDEKVVYLLDPIGASRRSLTLRLADRAIRTLHLHRDLGFELPYVPPFLRKDGGLVLSIGQFMQHMAGEISGSGLVQIWPGMPVAEALAEKWGASRESAWPIRARSWVWIFTPPSRLWGDGPVGRGGAATRPASWYARRPSSSRVGAWDEVRGRSAGVDEINSRHGVPHHRLSEPEIFGFFYVHPGNVASVGIFVPSWFRSPLRTAYRYLQHYVMHPYLWRHLQGGKLRSWGAKSLEESGRRGEPFLAGDGFARIGEGSGSTNVLTGSGVMRRGPPVRSWRRPWWSWRATASRSHARIWRGLMCGSAVRVG